MDHLMLRYSVELYNFDSGLPDEFKTRFADKPTKASILAAIDRLRELFANHYEGKYLDQLKPGGCGPEECIKANGKVVGFIRIADESEDDEE
jgi:hypothetical protein